MTISRADSEGNSPLHIAASNGDTATVNVLISAGADLNAKDSNGSTPLHLPVAGGHVEAAQALLKAGAEISDTNTRQAPAHQAPRVVGKPLSNEGAPFIQPSLRQSSRTPTMTSARSGVEERSVPEPIAGYRLCSNCGIQNRGWIELCVGCKFPMSGELQEKSSNDVFVWIAAFVPFAVTALEWIAFEQGLSGGSRYLLFAVIYFILFGIDLWRINADGFELDGLMIIGLVLLAPLYLFRRVAVVEGSYRYSYATVWVITFVLSVLITALVLP